jgi:cardiolipin synthase
VAELVGAHIVWRARRDLLAEETVSERSLDEEARSQGETEEHLHDIWTVANIITVLRLVLVPFAFAALVSDPDGIAAFILYVTAASTDWLDGQIARRTGTVTVIGKAIDPLVDRLLLASGVIGLYIVGRLPWWIVVLLVARDAYLLFGAWRLEKYHLRMPVTLIGKATTAVLMTAFSLLILGWPTLEIAGQQVYLGTILVYVGLVLSYTAAAQYTVLAMGMAREVRGAEAFDGEQPQA